MATVMRKIEFDAGHRLLNHEGKCKYLHGHRYVAEIFCITYELDKMGMVVDFGLIKSLVKTWIDKNWDHNTILNSKDPLVDAMILSGPEAKWSEPHDCTGLANFESAWERPPFLLYCNPTAENMAERLLQESVRLFREAELPKELQIEKVRLWETPNCFAEFMNPVL